MKEKNLVNLTGVNIFMHLYEPERKIILIPAMNLVARFGERCGMHERAESINGFPVRYTQYAGPFGLPEPCEDTIYIVSPQVRDFVKRDDVVSVDETFGAIKNKKRKVIGYQAFVKYKGQE